MGIFTPKWMKDSNETKKLTYTDLLEKAALHGKNTDVRVTAIEKIGRADFLYGILERAPSGELTPDQLRIMNACLDKLARLSRKRLVQAATDLSDGIRALAGSRLSEQEAYPLLLKSSEEFACGLVARINDPGNLRRLSEKTDRPHLAKTALERLETVEAENLQRKKEQEAANLQKVWEMAGGQRKYSRQVLTELSAESLLEIAKRAQDYFIKTEAVSCIKDQEILKQIVLSGDYSDRQRKYAAEQIDDPAFPERVLRDPALPADVLLKAMEKTDDPSLLRMIAEDGRYPEYVRLSALERGVFPQEYYLDIVWNGDNIRLRRGAVGQIRSEDELMKIRSEIGEEELKAYACERLGHEYELIRTWDEHARRGDGYRSHFVSRCRLCGHETEDITEYDG